MHDPLPQPHKEAIRADKAAMRTLVRQRRNSQTDRDRLSRHILAQLVALPEYAAARTVMCYLSIGAEVETHDLPHRAWADNKRVVIPYCTGPHLDAFVLHGLEQLEPGTWGILEPKDELRPLADYRIEPERLDLIVSPGVAFDRQGGRLGNGMGYYDRFLARVPLSVPKIGLGFDCQMVAAVPMTADDVYLDKIITEQAIYDRTPRATA